MVDVLDGHRLHVLQRLDVIVGKGPESWTNGDFTYVYAHMTPHGRRIARPGLHHIALGMPPMLRAQAAVTFCTLLDLPRLLRKPKRIGLHASLGPDGSLGVGVGVE